LHSAVNGARVENENSWTFHVSHFSPELGVHKFHPQFFKTKLFAYLKSPAKFQMIHLITKWMNYSSHKLDWDHREFSEDLPRVSEKVIFCEVKVMREGIFKFPDYELRHRNARNRDILLAARIGYNTTKF
jgi:hypothetical protein